MVFLFASKVYCRKCNFTMGTKTRTFNQEKLRTIRSDDKLRNRMQDIHILVFKSVVWVRILHLVQVGIYLCLFNSNYQTQK